MGGRLTQFQAWQCAHVVCMPALTLLQGLASEEDRQYIWRIFHSSFDQGIGKVFAMIGLH